MKKTASDIEHCKNFITGENVPFENVAIKKDDVWSALVTESDNDVEAIELLMLMCSSVAKVLKEKVKDHLAEGIHSVYNDEVHERLKSVKLHNKLPEWTFGYLDWMLHHRPNATRISNEAHLMFTANKTLAWLNEKQENEIEKLVKWTKSEIKQIKQTEMSRLKMLQDELEQISIQKEKNARAIQAKLISEKQTLTNSIVKYELWDTEEQIDLKLSEIKGVKHKTDCVKDQIKFRNIVLQQ